MHLNIKYKYILFLLMMVMSVSFLSCSDKRKLKPWDWIPTYKDTDTRPYGTYICYNLLDDIFKKKIKSSRLTITDQVNDLIGTNDYREVYDYDYGEYTRVDFKLQDYSLCEMYEDGLNEKLYNYIFILDDFSPYNDHTDRLVDFVGTGNSVFISSVTINTSFLEKIGLRSILISNFADSTYTIVDYPQKQYEFTNVGGVHTILDVDSCTLPYEVLVEDKQGNPSSVQVKYGYGYFYIHTSPEAFTNYYMLDDKRSDFAFRILSYLKEDNETIWDESLKKGSLPPKKTFFSFLNDGMFQEIFKSPPLRFAFLLFLLSALLFMIFNAKRKQRIIPILTEPKNTTIDFLNTISNMYYRKRDYVASVEQRHKYFLDYIRRNFYLSTEQIDKEFIENLSAKTEVPTHMLKDIFEYRDAIVNGDNSKDLYTNYTNTLEVFYKTIRNK